LAELNAKAKLIIWDEAPIIHKHCFEFVDRALMYVLQSYKNGGLSIPFGGNLVVLGGDFCQILLITPTRPRHEVVHATINSSYRWNFCEVLTLTLGMILISGST